MSDRVALLRSGQLEQIASPREIYSRPATSYAAQFIGHTNLLGVEVRNGVARYKSLSWPVQLSDGPALFSLRPECVHIANDSFIASGNVVSFRARIRNRAFHGATELLQVECGDGSLFSVRVGASDLGQGELKFQFSSEDAVPVRDSQEKV
jgi:ABC-type Fe3+/spermidine/putrescine transport system ATPase subunit